MRPIIASMLFLAGACGVEQTARERQAPRLENPAIQTAVEAAPVTRANATVINAQGDVVGSVAFIQTTQGVLVNATFDGLAPGAKAIHIHETGACAPDFGAAGDHFDPMKREHGFASAQGPHAGDFPNIYIGENGSLKVEFLNSQLSLEPGARGSVIDEDGSAVMVHAGADDYISQPSGNAGDRIACGVIEPAVP